MKSALQSGLQHTSPLGFHQIYGPLYPAVHDIILQTDPAVFPEQAGYIRDAESVHFRQALAGQIRLQIVFDDLRPFKFMPRAYRKRYRSRLLLVSIDARRLSALFSPILSKAAILSFSRV